MAIKSRLALIVKSYLLAFIIVASAHTACAEDYVEDFRLDGFRDLKWGDAPDKLGQDATLIASDDKSSSYCRFKEKSSIYGIWTKQPSYSFSRDGLEHVAAYFHGYDTLGRFLALFGKHGILMRPHVITPDKKNIPFKDAEWQNLWIAESRETGISLLFYSGEVGEIQIYRVRP